MTVEGRKINLIYGAGREEETHALKDVDIALPATGITVVTGPSGCGKSSLLYVLSGLRRGGPGNVFYDDCPLHVFSDAELASIRRTKFGFIFQKHFLIEIMTVLDNLLTAANDNGRDSTEKAMSLLEQLEIGSYARLKPFRLSFGQRQKAAVARALMNDPEVIFADEPTASLDQAGTAKVIEIFRSYRSASSILISTHDPSVLEAADRRYEMSHGTIVSAV